MKKYLVFFIVTLLIVLTFTSTALANDDEIMYTMLSREAITDNNIMEKQYEIDKYLFEDHIDEIAEMGFEVTYTAPVENFIEIGIIPYNQEYSDYLKIFLVMK